MHTKSRVCWLLALCLLCLLIGVSSAGEKDTPPGKDFSGVDFRDGLLRVSVENRKFHRVMDEVAREAGVKIVINDTTDKDLTIDFDYLPLEKGLKRLLRGKNYVFIYRSMGGADLTQSFRLVKVLTFPKSGGWTVTGLREIAEHRSADRAEQTVAMKEMLNPDQEERLEEVLTNFSSKGIYLGAQLYSGLQKLREMGVSREMTKLEDDILQAFPQGRGELIEKINEALEKLRIEAGAEGILGAEAIERFLREGETEKIRAMVPE